MLGPVVLLVTSPGIALDAYTPLVSELRAGGAEVVPVVFPCSGSFDDHVAQVRRVAGSREVVVLAHGLGATVALNAADTLEVERWVLVAPVLDVVVGPGLEALAAAPVASGVDLRKASDRALEVYGGEGARERVRCVSAAVAREVQGWMRAEHVPVDPAAVTAPVWLSVGLLDEVATVEATLDTSRRFPDRTVVRPGVNRLDPEDYRHLDLVTDAVPRRLAVHAALEGW